MNSKDQVLLMPARLEEHMKLLISKSKSYGQLIEQRQMLRAEMTRFVPGSRLYSERRYHDSQMCCPGGVTPACQPFGFLQKLCLLQGSAISQPQLPAGLSAGT